MKEQAYGMKFIYKNATKLINKLKKENKVVSSMMLFRTVKKTMDKDGEYVYPFISLTHFNPEVVNIPPEKEEDFIKYELFVFYELMVGELTSTYFKEVVKSDEEITSKERARFFEEVIFKVDEMKKITWTED